MTLPAALAPMAAVRQWVTYRLVPNEKGKTDKLPCNWQTGNVSSAHEPGNWTTYEQAIANAHRADVGHGCGAGFVLSPGDDFWFVDIDGCLTINNEWSPLALELCSRLSGAAVEVSQSGTGLHIIGSGRVPDHRCKNIPLGLELYTERRFIAITGTSAQGLCTVDTSEAIASVVADYFAPKADSGSGPLDDWTSEPCEGWNGPVDDDDLIRRARKTKPKVSAEAALRGGTDDSVSFDDLWVGNVEALSRAWPGNRPDAPYDASSVDMSLALRLAFWTGRDCERIERLMRMSGVMRDKYERRDYIERTIMGAAGMVQAVCQDAPTAPAGPPVEVSLSGPDGNARTLSLSSGELENKQNHLAVEFWFTAGGNVAAYDEFSDRILLNGQKITDHTERRCWFQTRELSQMPISKDLFSEVLRDVAWNNRFHPLLAWLDETEATWDGVPRLDSWLTTYLGVPDNDYTRAVGAIFLTAAVRRVRDPGCKFDELMVLEGPQGIGKSSAISTLCPSVDWFSEDFTVALTSKEVLEVTLGKWIVEAPELSKLRESEVSHVKHLLSRRFDSARMAYGHHRTDRGRQWVAFATVNGSQYLSDPTGNRRFWPVLCDKVRVDRLEQDRGQLWAEAAQRERAGASIRLPEALWALAAVEQAERVFIDPLMEVLSESLGEYEHGRVLVADIWALLNIPIDKRSSHGKKVRSIMSMMGWEYTRRRVVTGGKPEWLYVKGNELPLLSFDITSHKFISERAALRSA